MSLLKFRIFLILYVLSFPILLASDNTFFIATSQCSNLCDGSSQNPFSNIVDATTYIFSRFSNTSEENIVFVFLNQTSSISDSDLENSPYMKTNDIWNLLYDFPLLNISFKGDSIVDLEIKSNLFQFIVPHQIVFEKVNIIFNDSRAITNRPFFLVVSNSNKKIIFRDSAIICFKNTYFITFIGSIYNNISNLDNINVHFSNISLESLSLKLYDFDSNGLFVNFSNISIKNSMLTNDNYLIYLKGNSNNFEMNDIKIENSRKFIYLEENIKGTFKNFLITNSLDNLFSFSKTNFISLINFVIMNYSSETSSFFSFDTSNNCSIVNMTSENTSQLFSLNFNNYLEISLSMFYSIDSKKSGGLAQLSSSNTLNFTKNLVKSCSSAKDGGFLSISDQKNLVYLNDNLFYSITSKNKGGVFSNIGRSQIFIYKTFFYNLKANIWGGLIIISNGYLAIKDCWFSNLVSGMGSLFHADQSEISIDNVTINGSYSYYSSNGSYGFSGGVMHANSSNIITISNVLILNSSNALTGGVFHFGTSNLFNFNGLVVFNTSTIQQSACGYFYLSNKGSINNLSLIHSYSKIGCGFIIDSSNDIIVTNSDFYDIFYIGDYELEFNLDDYYVATISGTLGLMYSNVIFIQNCTFIEIIGNGASAISLYSNNSAIIKNITCDTHTNINNDGMILSQWENNLTISSSKFYNGKSYNGPAITLYQYSIVSITNTAFKNLITYPYQDASGGCIYLWEFNDISINNCSFSNTQGKTGGCIFLGNDNKALINNSFFLNNTAEREGGSLGAWERNIYDVFNSVFNHTVSSISGGAFSFDSSSIGYFLNITSFDNHADELGGVFLVNYNIQIEIINSTFTLSSANLGGGFMCILILSTVRIENSMITQSNSVGLGGVFYLMEMNSLSLESNIIGHSMALGDGVIVLAKYSNMLIDNNSNYIDFQVEENANQISNYLGGFNAIFNNIFTLINVNFEKIHSIYLGGIFYFVIFNTITANNVKFNNISTLLMGTFGFFIDMNDIKLQNIIASDLTTQGFGAFAYLFFGNNLTIKNSSLFNISTKTYDGGVFYLKDSNHINLENLQLSEILCSGSGSLAFFSSYNEWFSVNITARNVFAQGSGDLFFSENSNNISLEKTSLLNDKFEKNLQSSLIYLKIDSNVYINKMNASLNCHQDGCIVYFFRYNRLNLVTSSFYIVYATEDFSFFYLNADNQFNLENSTVITLDFMQYNNYFIYAYQNNTANLSFNCFSFQYLTVFYQSMFFNKFNSYRDFINKTSYIGYVYYINYNSTLFLENHSINFFIYTNYIVSDSSRINLRNIHLKNRNAYILINIQKSDLKIRKSTFSNDFGKRNSLITSNNSNISLDKVIVLGFKSSANISLLNIFNLVNDESGFLNNITIGRSLFFNNMGYLGGSIKLLAFITKDFFKRNPSNPRQNFIFTKNRAIFNRANDGGAIFFSTNQSNYHIAIKDSTFIHNQGEKGASIFIKSSSHVNITANIFNKSKAKAFSGSLHNESNPTKGGAIFYTNSSNLSILTIKNNKFSENQANIGGVLFLNGIPITNFNSNSFLNNKADFFAPSFSSLVTNITFLSNGYLFSSLEIKNVVSGLYYQNCLFQIAGLDYYGNLAFKNNDNIISKIKINTLSKNLSNTLKYHQNDGFICFDGPFTRDQSPIQSHFLYQAIYQNNKANLLNFTMDFRNCEIGERLTEDNECVECENGTYSFETNFNNTFSCSACHDFDPFVCEGGSKLHPKENYWRIDKYSDNFQECPKVGICYSIDFEDVFKTKSSLDKSYYTGYCSKGYTGPLCNVCEEGFGKSDKNSCIKCSDTNNWYYFMFIFIKIILKLLYTFYCVYIGFKMMVTIISHKISNGVVCAIGLLKILVIHFQILSFLPKLPLQWSVGFQTVLPLMFSISPDMSDSFNFECFLKIYHSNIENTYLVLILCPIYIILMFLISVIIVFLKKVQLKKNRDVINSISSLELALCVLFIIIMLSYIDIGKTNFEMFQCVNIGNKNDNILRLMNDLNIDCNGFPHKLWIFWISLPVLAISTFIIIVLIYQLVSAYYYNRLKEIDVKFALGYFYFAYKEDLFFWDIVILVRRLLILFVFMFYYEKIFLKDVFPLILIYLIIVNSFLLQAYFNPFAKEYQVLNNAEICSLLVLSLTYVMTIFYSTSFFKNWNFTTEYFALMISGIILLNVGYLIYWFFLYYSKYLSRRLSIIIANVTNIKNLNNLVFINSLASFLDYLDKKKYITSYNLTKESDLQRFLYKEMIEKLNEKLKSISDIELLKDIHENNEEIDENYDLKTNEKKVLENLVQKKKLIKLNKKDFRTFLDINEIKLDNISYIYSNLIQLKYKRNLNFDNHYEYFFSDSIRIICSKAIQIEKYGVFIQSDGYFSFRFTKNMNYFLKNRY